uniref:Uncharacterized protein n=1 Tax=Mycena chlorophos TaxID=658473 RepID=A0ABQ0L3V3_MYCCL|nr:predicted protein [Mycena chlorophos]
MRLGWRRCGLATEEEQEDDVPQARVGFLLPDWVRLRHSPQMLILLRSTYPAMSLGRGGDACLFLYQPRREWVQEGTRTGKHWQPEPGMKSTKCTDRDEGCESGDGLAHDERRRGARQPHCRVQVVDHDFIPPPSYRTTLHRTLVYRKRRSPVTIHPSAMLPDAPRPLQHPTLMATASD